MAATATCRKTDSQPGFQQLHVLGFRASERMVHGVPLPVFLVVVEQRKVSHSKEIPQASFGVEDVAHGAYSDRRRPRASHTVGKLMGLFQAEKFIGGSAATACSSANGSAAKKPAPSCPNASGTERTERSPSNSFLSLRSV